MAKPFETWTVFAHRPIEKLESNLWRVEGDLPGSDSGTRVMTIVKNKSGGLVIHNAIALEEEQMKEIEAFGDPATIIVPNGFHRLDAKIYKARYPKAKVVAPDGSRKKVEQVVKVDATYEGKASDGITLTHLDGVKNAEGIVEVDTDGKKTIIFNDFVNNLEKQSGIMGFVLAPTGMPAVPRISRWLMIKDMKAFRANLERIAEMKDLSRIIVSHGKVISEDAGAVLKTVAARLG